MIPKSKIKLVKSLQVKKYRKQEQCFVVEGMKSVEELLKSDFEVIWVAGSISFINRQEKLIKRKGCEVLEATEHQLEDMGNFQTNDAALAIARTKPNVLLKEKGNVQLILDNIRDPGNMGTIIRTADWYGIRQIIASEGTTDVYNPKVISATMGSFCRVNIYYTPLIPFIQQIKVPVFGTFLNGLHIHQVNFPSEAYIVIGNEAKGISPEVTELVTQRITIPKWGDAESLNAGVAAAVILDNLRRSQK
jgi:RNA methyltransferase, TrmH family